MEHENTCPSYLVPSSLYMCIDSETKDVVGMIDIRHYLNENLLETGGNIGYTIAIDHRNKGYGKIQLQLAIDKIKKEIYKKIDPKKLSITTKILITCNENNIASKKIIIANGGVLENKVLKNGEVIERYWINLK